MDPLGAFIRIADGRSPRLGAQISWMRERRRGDFSVHVVEEFVRPGQVVLDIGADVGRYTWRLAQLVGPSGHVYVFEPNPASQRALRLVRGGRRNVTIHPVALSDHAGEADLHIPVVEDRRASASVRRYIKALARRASAGVDQRPISALGRLAVPRGHAELGYQVVPIRTERLDAMVLDERRPVTFIKCDVEGHELPVLRGAEAVLRRSRPALLIEIEQRHQDGTDIQEVFDYLDELGYVGYVLQAGGLRPLSEFDVDRDQVAFLGPGFQSSAMPRGYSNNFLFVAPRADVARLMAPG